MRCATKRRALHAHKKKAKEQAAMRFFDDTNAFRPDYEPPRGCSQIHIPNIFILVSNVWISYNEKKTATAAGAGWLGVCPLQQTLNWMVETFVRNTHSCSNTWIVGRGIGCGDLGVLLGSYRDQSSIERDIGLLWRILQVVECVGRKFRRREKNILRIDDGHHLDSGRWNGSIFVCCVCQFLFQQCI